MAINKNFPFCSRLICFQIIIQQSNINYSKSGDRLIASLKNKKCLNLFIDPFIFIIIIKIYFIQTHMI